MNSSANYWSLTRLLIILAALIVSDLAGQTIERVDAIGMTVNDMDRALAFYTQVLPFEKVSDVAAYGEPYEELTGLFGIHFRKVRLRLGTEYLELTDYLTPGGRPIPSDARSNDLWFQHIAIVVSNMDSAYALLKRQGVTHVSTVPQTLPQSIPNAAGIKAFYFRDPDGHNLELIWFPPGKGDPKWQTGKDKLFMGIDHTAIGIANTEASRSFYEQQLGIRYQGESYNFGNEQSHLNNVSGARLHISAYRAPMGAGVEFLEYLSPKGGRPYPADERSDDLVHWETIMTTPDARKLFDKLKAAGAEIVSTTLVNLPSNSNNFRRGFYVRDPDGHVVGIFDQSPGLGE